MCNGIKKTAAVFFSVMSIRIIRIIRIMMILMILMVISSCSIEDMIIEKLADSLSSGMGQSFTGEDDPQLVGEALPFALKLYDSLLEKAPRHVNLLLATGSAYIMYANAYVQTPAEMLPRSRYQEKQALLIRAKRFYLRGRGMIMRALDVKYPGFSDQLNSNDPGQALDRCGKDAAPFLYWGCAGLFAAYAADIFDIQISIMLPKALLLMEKKVREVLT